MLTEARASVPHANNSALLATSSVPPAPAALDPAKLIYDSASGHYWDPEKRCWSLYPAGTVDSKAREVALQRLGEQTQVRLSSSSSRPPVPEWKPLPPPPLTAEQVAAQQQGEYEMKLRQRGWKKNSEGNWIKDENVEFDSDEEAPPPELLAQLYAAKR